MERERGVAHVPAIDIEDMKTLRKNIFLTNYEQREHFQQMKMMKMHWDTTKPYIYRRDIGLNRDPVIEAFCIDNRALESTDVLENIAVYLTKSELLSCRLVCKMWSTEMGRYLQKRKSLIVTDEHCGKAGAVLKNRQNGNPVALSRLCLFDVSSGSVLYKKLFKVFGYTLSSVSLEECNLSVQDLKIMLVNEAPNIETFHYKEATPARGSKISTLKQIKLLNDDKLLLPNLKMLHWDESDGLTELREIIDAFPNLVTLELRNFPIPKSQAFKDLTCPRLKSIFLSPTVLNEEHCKALTHLKLKLKRLTLFGLNPAVKKSMKSLTRFLSSVSETLEVMELWLDYASTLSNPETTIFTSPFPVYMPKVRRLQTEVEIIGHIKNLNKFPALAELEIVSNPYERQNWQSMTKRVFIKPHEKLQTLRCGDIDYKSMNKVMKVFPQIAILQLYATHVNDSFLRSVITNLPGLSDLSISRCMKTNALALSDSGVTGISKEICEKLKLTGKLENVNMDEAKIHPGIGDLQHLRKLDFGLQVSEFTDISVILGISKLTKLACLKLPMCKITTVSLHAITEKMKSLILLSIAGCDQISPEAIENLKKKGGLLVENELPPVYV
ncbi:Antagonist of mitotic exit network protein 1 [Orchesella cincta]|uniref:Antagonist of mitotic exit network protein 1 n=1 Tax=Orchesella cincta TaxID=48709 RepID=A0A1D2MPW0_ORCCI|nr:Antagonist of mitotic exit network protein 1 [Orchesella cincta]